MKYRALTPLIAATALVLSGCASSSTDEVFTSTGTESGDNVSSESVGSESSDAPVSVEPEEDVELVQPDAGAEDGFGLVQAVSVIKNSCEKSLSDGVTETYLSGDGSVEGYSVLVPDEYAVDGYSAAYTDGESLYELIFETDQLASCTLNNAIVLAEESAGMEGSEATESLEPAELFAIIDFSEGSFTASLGDPEDVESPVFDISYNVGTSLMTDFVRVGPAGEESSVITVEFGYNEKMRDTVRQAHDNFFN